MENGNGAIEDDAEAAGARAGELAELVIQKFQQDAPRGDDPTGATKEQDTSQKENSMLM